MQKNNIKNFVCSFLFSLLAVVAVNKVFFRAPAQKQALQAPEHPQTQKISLFEAENPLEISLLKAPEADFDVSEIEKLTLSQSPEPVQKTALAEPKAQKTPKQTASAQTASKMINTDLSAATEIVLPEDPAEIETAALKKLEQTSGIVYADISDTVKDEQKLSESQNAPVLYAGDEPQNTPVLYAGDISENPSETKTPPQEPIVVASAEPEDADIPLALGSETFNGKIEVSSSADSSQIAMLEPNMFVRSIQNTDFEEHKNIAEADLKVDQITDVSPEEDSPWIVARVNKADVSSAVQDSPWIVARGNKYAKNQAVVEQFSDDEEEPEDTEEEIFETENLTEETVSEPENTELQTTEPETTAETHVEAEAVSEPVAEQTEPVAELSEPEQVEPVVEQTEPENTEIQEPVVESSEPEQTEPVVEPSGPQADEPQESKVSSLENFISEEMPQKLTLRPLENDEDNTKLAYQMIQNILIPIPEDILNDANLTPNLSESPKAKNKAKQDPEMEKIKELPLAKKNQEELEDSEKKSGLFKNISTWFNKKSNEQKKDNLISQITGKVAEQKKKFSIFSDDDESAAKIMPAELRLSFQPNRAEISGQTLKWIHAFADNARDNDGIYIEVRIDGTSSLALQQKRLNLLSSILAGRGVDFRKINIIFTSREPNSFIIRNIQFNDMAENQREQKEKETKSKLYQPW